MFQHFWQALWLSLHFLIKSSCIFNIVVEWYQATATISVELELKKYVQSIFGNVLDSCCILFNINTFYILFSINTFQ